MSESIEHASELVFEVSIEHGVPYSEYPSSTVNGWYRKCSSMKAAEYWSRLNKEDRKNITFSMSCIKDATTNYQVLGKMTAEQYGIMISAAAESCKKITGTMQKR